MNMLAIGGEYWTSADEPADHRQSGFKNRQSKRNHRDRDGDHGRGLLCAAQGERTQHEADEKTSAVPQKNRGWIEIETKKTKNRSDQCQRQQGNQNRAA